MASGLVIFDRGIFGHRARCITSLLAAEKGPGKFARLHSRDR